ncbi:Cell division inhibitor MinD [Piscirickettsia salmonis]|uniref:Iron-sulfur cluster carrier protein n=1 Tax=Piscirickettsia salmonis TaxID=1238 RepID=A0AAC8VI70_PISSA|nr:iron-sulfur cluster carrier protein ApbC [Piscirickettsia salmonis]ALB23032.1 ATPase [Piscirickettsia salmonis]QGN98365.1 Cell division inhibitor MinD [Piscirickettsia salmonis]QGO01986.1 Cell division inhibitor MinD [Piscirickettsia salmonis]QGO12673.1 Cell division inhibitor MinD [Piscirickettsia salmonis]QGO19716.1 Cell division inhibitor MinD [Piscirickettsia salmonis]
MIKQFEQKKIEQMIKDVLLKSGISDVYTGQSVAERLTGVECSEGGLKITLCLNYPCQSRHVELAEKVKNALQAQAQLFELSDDLLNTVTVMIEQRVQAQRIQKNLKRINGVKNIIAIASGKGGVGKSTTALNLALALQAEGGRVGILDADIYGPSQPHLLGADTHPESKDKKSIEPVERFGLQTMSIGYLLEDQAVIWRAPMATGALLQLLQDTRWKDLDYLLLDLPPGTGDIQLTMSQKIPVSAAIMITTPQDIALLDVRRGVHMFNKVNVSVLGIIENMSTHICRQCGHEEAIFGTGGGQHLADEFDTELLGQLPLDLAIRQGADTGESILLAEPSGEISQHYYEIARRFAAKLSLQAKDFSHHFSNIIVES